MTKFTGPDDPGFVAVCGELRRWIRDTNAVERRHIKLPHSRSSDLNEKPGTANQGSNYESGGGAMHFGMIPPKEPTK